MRCHTIALFFSLITVLLTGCSTFPKLNENEQQELHQANTVVFVSNDGVERLHTRDDGALAKLIASSIVNDIYEEDFSDLANYPVNGLIEETFKQANSSGVWPIKGPIRFTPIPKDTDHRDATWKHFVSDWLEQQPDLIGKDVVIAKSRVTLRSNFNGVWALLNYSIWFWDAEKEAHKSAFQSSASFSEIMVPMGENFIETPYDWAERLKPMVNDLNAPIRYCLDQTFRMAGYNLDVILGDEARGEERRGLVYEDDEYFWKRGREGYYRPAWSDMSGERK